MLPPRRLVGWMLLGLTVLAGCTGPQDPARSSPSPAGTANAGTEPGRGLPLADPEGWRAATWRSCTSIFAQAMMAHPDFGTLPPGFTPESFPPPDGPVPAQFVNLAYWQCGSVEFGNSSVAPVQLAYLSIPVVPPPEYRNATIARNALAWSFSPQPEVAALLVEWRIGVAADVQVQRTVTENGARAWSFSVSSNGTSYSFGVEQARVDVMNRSYSGEMSRRIGFDGGNVKGIVDQRVDFGPTRGDLGGTSHWDVSGGPGPFAVRPRYAGAGPVGFSTPFDASWQWVRASSAPSSLD